MTNKQIVAKYLHQNRQKRKVIRRLGHKRRIPVLVTEFVCVTDLVPSTWTGWFWDMVSSDAPFSWGDNNRTFVTADRFADHCEDLLEDIVEDGEITVGAKREWLKKIRRLGQIYVDLEN